MSPGCQIFPLCFKTKMYIKIKYNRDRFMRKRYEQTGATMNAKCNTSRNLRAIYQSLYYIKLEPLYYI